MNKTFVISDMHFNHSNIIKYCDRPFESVEEMNEKLIQNWNNTVSKDDKIYCLGDFCLGGKTLCREIVQRLNGKKFLIYGNHDFWKKSFYEECGFESVSKFPVVLNINSHPVILSHAPLYMNDCKFGEEKVYNLYGHVHNNMKEFADMRNSLCVSVENIMYRPIELERAIMVIDSNAKLQDMLKERGISKEPITFF